MGIRKFVAEIFGAAYTGVFAVLVVAVWFGLMAIILFFILLFSILAWKLIGAMIASEIYQAIFNVPEAAAALIGVLIAGLFGFGGIILTNSLSARATRRHAEYLEEIARQDRQSNERAARAIQVEIARGLDLRLKEFAEAFAKYHAETIAAIVKSAGPRASNRQRNDDES